MHDADFSLGGTDSYESNVSMSFVRVGSYLFGFGPKTYPGRLAVPEFALSATCSIRFKDRFLDLFELVSKPIPNKKRLVIRFAYCLQRGF